MAGTRSSARQAAAAAHTGSSTSQSQFPAKAGAAGSKRKGSTASSPKSKRGKKGDGKEQATIEATMPIENTESSSKDVEMKDDVSTCQGAGDANDAKNGVEQTGNGGSIDSGETFKTENNLPTEQESQRKDDRTEAENTKPVNGHTQSAGAKAQSGAETDQNGATSKIDGIDTTKNGDNPANEGGAIAPEVDDAVEKSSKREESTPSSILEKGIIYFFFRGRININEPSEVNDIARSYIVLRPLPHGAKLGDGPIGDAGNNRLLALPKKVLPVSPKDRFMVFVEKPKASLEEIKNDLASSDYMTKTAGSRHTPAAAPIGEGVYAITTTGRESHIAYILTIPSELSAVQHDVGLKERGSFVTSVKNPQHPGPANTNLPKAAEYPQEYGATGESYMIGILTCHV